MVRESTPEHHTCTLKTPTSRPIRYRHTERVVDEVFDEETGDLLSSTTLVHERQGRGGAIHIEGDGSLTVHGSQFIDNQSRWGGGAITVRTPDGTATISESAVRSQPPQVDRVVESSCGWRAQTPTK